MSQGADLLQQQRAPSATLRRAGRADEDAWAQVVGDEALERPDLMVIGAPRCGTTSMYDGLAQHPEIHMSPHKEPQFLAYAGLPPWRGPHDAQGVRDRDVYQHLFQEAGPGQRTGEASTLYLWSPQAPVIASRVLPEDTRVVAMLRDPAGATWSRYVKARARGIEDRPDIFDAIDAETERRAAGWSPFWYYRSLRDYGPQLDRWFDALGSERVHVVLFDEYQADPRRTVQEVYRFFGVDDRFEPDTGVRRNVSGRPQDNLASRLLRSSNPLKKAARILPARTRERLWLRLRNRSMRPVTCPPEVRSRLTQLFEPEIARTEETLGRSLDTWRRTSR